MDSGTTTDRTANLLICASPCPKGTSAMLLRRVQQATGGEIHFLYREGAAAVLEHMAGAHTIVLSGPCFINIYPAKVMELLKLAMTRKKDLAGKKLYAISNGGMPYAHTHQSGLRTLALFCQACSMRYMGGLVLGVGAMLDGQSLEKHMNARRVVPAFEAFVAHIARGEPSPDGLFLDAQTRMSGFKARLGAAFLNRMVDKRLRSFGHDLQQKGPHAQP